LPRVAGGQVAVAGRAQKIICKGNQWLKWWTSGRPAMKTVWDPFKDGPMTWRASFFFPTIATKANKLWILGAPSSLHCMGAHLNMQHVLLEALHAKCL